MRLTAAGPALPTVLLAALLGVVVTGCAGQEPARGVRSVSDLVLPFDAYKPTPEQRAVLANARHRLVVRCMRRQGVTVNPPVESAASIAALDPGNSRRYGVVDTAVARRHGYHLARPPGARTSGAWANALPPAARGHLYGDRRRPGCLDRAARTLEDGGPRADWSWLGLQDALTLERAAALPEVAAAVERWQACMGQAGHAYAAPESAIADRRWKLEQPAISVVEKATATADTACKWSSGLVAAWYEADAALQRDLVRGHAPRFAAFRANLEHRVRTASRLLASDEGGKVR
ncbi:hypothetical protein HII36_32110 [Nonomuraea sp. NN258]|uniref:hypothetical protein n=1 Tax=Nonomuraea antri TaxID=2730852 RepID=UPI0015698030|nr:hypothetical protein [Nonomuraea antri]NRQ36444.1 hypothetical protein [Nonomuraea antri]